MKKLLVILLGFCFALPAFAAGVRAVDNDAWLDHLAKMQIIRQQILSLITRENPTAEDKALIETLNADFDAQKTEWDSYLVRVSQNQETSATDEVKVEPSKKSGSCPSMSACTHGKKHKKTVKACSKGKDCCQVTGKACTDPNCDSSKKECKPAKKRWGRHVCGEACKNGCIKPKKEECCGSAMCKEIGKCIRDAKGAHNCKGCVKASKCAKTTKKACDKADIKACSKGKDCCQVTGKACTDPNCDSSKKECKPAKKRWGRHVCGEACKNGCIQPKMKECCGSSMCKEIGKCIRNAKRVHNCKGCVKASKCDKTRKKACDKADVKACSKGKDCCQVTGKACTDPNCDSNKKGCCD